MTIQANIPMPDSQQYPWHLLPLSDQFNVKDIFLGLKVFNSDNFMLSCSRNVTFVEKRTF